MSISVYFFNSLSNYYEHPEFNDNITFFNTSRLGLADHVPIAFDLGQATIIN